jgi:hypothetical protein
MIRAGSIGMLGAGLNQAALLRALAATEGKGRREPRAKSVIYIFLSGGLSQIDSFDMKPDAPREIRGEFDPIPTRTPGLRICEHLPMLAERSERWALCRSLTHNWNEHSQGHHIMLTGRSDTPLGFDPNKPKPGDYPSIAALANTQLEGSGALPPSMVLPEKIVHRTGRTLPGQFAGMLGERWEPYFVDCSRYNAASYGAYPDYLFHHATGKVDGNAKVFREPELSLPEGVGLDRVHDRLDITRHLDRQRAHLGQSDGAREFDRYTDMAVSLLGDPKTRCAFDVHGADPKLQDKYGRNCFGWSLLMARQLVEAGVRLVQVNLGNNEAWDGHQAIFPNLKNYLLPPTDRAVSALLDDLADRGMLDDTLVVMASEFGRTPKIFTLKGAKLPGRDHWGAIQTAFFAGGGVTGGAVVGSSDATGGRPASEPQRPEDFAATIYQALGIPEGSTWSDLSGRPHFVYQGNPIEKLFS